MVPAAGLGTRLLSVTKEQPKEMLPVFARGKNGELCLKPIVQLVFEQLYQVGFREFGQGPDRSSLPVSLWDEGRGR